MTKHEIWELARIVAILANWKLETYLLEIVQVELIRVNDAIVI